MGSASNAETNLVISPLLQLSLSSSTSSSTLASSGEVAEKGVEGRRGCVYKPMRSEAD